MRTAGGPPLDENLPEAPHSLRRVSRTVEIFLDRLGLNATKGQMKELLEIVKEQSNLVKGSISLDEYRGVDPAQKAGSFALSAISLET